MTREEIQGRNGVKKALLIRRGEREQQKERKTISRDKKKGRTVNHRFKSYGHTCTEKVDTG